MRRRRFLSALGGAGASVLAAGCQSSDGEASPASTEETTVTPATTREATATRTTTEGPSVEERIAAADASLEEAATELEAAIEAVDVSGGQSEEFDAEPVEERLGEARSELDAARPDATPEQRETIEALEGAADFIEEFSQVIAEAHEASLALEEANREIDREQWEAAADPLERADDRASAAKVRLDEARATFEGIDTDQFGGLSGLEAEELESSLEEIDGLLTAIDQLITGLREAVRGMGALEAGSEAVDAEDWERAAEEFGTALDRFTTAQEQFERAESSAPPDFRSEMSTVVCQWSALRQAAQELERGAEAADQGDTDRARAAFEAADEAVQEGERCE